MHSLSRVAYSCAIERAVVLIGKVNVVRKERLEIQEAIAHIGDLAREATIQLVQHQPAHAFRRRVDQVADGLCLNEVELAVEHGASRELTGQRFSGAGV
jgi:hypothetical protein